MQSDMRLAVLIRVLATSVWIVIVLHPACPLQLTGRGTGRALAEAWRETWLVPNWGVVASSA
eukprot:11186750-Lingulodinium_polyedra.AAC.1